MLAAAALSASPDYEPPLSAVRLDFGPAPSSSHSAERPIVGRANERATIDELLAGIRAGANRALVLRGAPGIGKTTLLEYAVASASDLRVSRIAGAEAEMSFGFAGLHQLLVPFLDGLDSLPAPQRDVLQSAFGLVAHGAPDLFLVGLSTLTLLSNAARHEPLLCVVDDAQWLDRASTTVLSFVARRLTNERVGIIASSSSPTCDPFDALPTIELEGLSGTDARELLAFEARGPVATTVADHIVAATHGNPLALVEMPAALTDDQLRGETALPQPLPVAPDVQERYLFQIRALNCDAQTLLLLAAAERNGETMLLRRAADRLGMEWDDAVTAVEGSQLVTFHPEVVFRHPLVRSAVYYGARPADRRAMHRALAETLDDDSDADRRAWHLAAATVGPDDTVSRSLERSATLALQRKGSSEAVALLERAAELTTDATRSGLCLLRASLLELAAGAPGRAQAALDRARSRLQDEQHLAAADRAQALVWLGAGRIRGVHELLAGAAQALATRDTGLALDSFLWAEHAALAAGRLANGDNARAVALAARRALDVHNTGTPTEALLDALVSHRIEGYDAAAPKLRAALDALRSLEESGRTLGFVVAGALLDDGARHDLAASWVRAARRNGALTTLPTALNSLSWCEVVAGRFTSAESHTAQAEQIISMTGTRATLTVPAPADVLRHAWEGDVEATRRDTEMIAEHGRSVGQGSSIDMAQTARVVLELGLGNYDTALRFAKEIYDHDSLEVGTVVLPDLIEAAVRCGDHALVSAAFARLSRRAIAAGTQWARGLLARSAALVDANGAEAHFLAALDHLSRCTVATDFARTQLMYGEWLRRARRRREAREQLRLALGFFERIGAKAFAARARRELDATGERARGRSVETQFNLTPQEVQVANLAGQGATNAEIAAQLFLSTSTVEYHLRKVFRKLDVRSRTQLALLQRSF